MQPPAVPEWAAGAGPPGARARGTRGRPPGWGAAGAGGVGARGPRGLGDKGGAARAAGRRGRGRGAEAPPPPPPLLSAPEMRGLPRGRGLMRARGRGRAAPAGSRGRGRGGPHRGRGRPRSLLSLPRAQASWAPQLPPRLTSPPAVACLPSQGEAPADMGALLLEKEPRGAAERGEYGGSLRLSQRKVPGALSPELFLFLRSSRRPGGCSPERGDPTQDHPRVPGAFWSLLPGLCHCHRGRRGGRHPGRGHAVHWRGTRDSGGRWRPGRGPHAAG